MTKYLLAGAFGTFVSLIAACSTAKSEDAASARGHDDADGVAHDGGEHPSTARDAGAEEGGSSGSTTFAPVRIDFDNLAAYDKVTNQYADHATFSTNPDWFVTVRDDGLNGQSPPNYICIGFEDGECGESGHQFIIDFTRPVRKLAFVAVGIGEQKAGTIKVTHDGGVSSVDIVQQANTEMAKVDLSAFTGITHLEIDDTDEAGIGIDTLTFEQAN